ncbi:hypothetical protein ABEF95_006865 [Exophiala dermatitidis]
MIPPLPESTLAANPAFARLWEYLTTEILRSDASRRCHLGNRWDGDGEPGLGEESLVTAMTGSRLDGGYERFGEVEGRLSDADDDDEDGDEKDEYGEIAEQQQRHSLDTKWGQDYYSKNTTGQNGEKKTKTKKKASFEARLQQYRINGMKAYILRSMLADATYYGSMREQRPDSGEVEADRTGERRSTTTLAHLQPQMSKSTTETIKAQPSELRDLLLLISAYLDVSTSMGLRSSVNLSQSQSQRQRPEGPVLTRRPGLEPYRRQESGSGTQLSVPAEAEDRNKNGEAEAQSGGHTQHHDLQMQLYHLLEEEIARFKESLPVVGELVGSRIVQVESALGEIAALATTSIPITNTATTTTTTSTNTRGVGSQTSGEPRPLLSNHIEAQLSQLRHLQSDVLAKRLSDITSHSQTLLALQRELIGLQLQHLERSKHGVLHRHSMARLGFLKIVAEAMELKTRVAVLETKRDLERNRTRGDGDVDSDIVARRLRDLDSEEVEADERLAALERLLKEYDAVVRPEEQQKTGGGGEKLMQKLGARYKEIEGEMEARRGAAKAEVAELKAEVVDRQSLTLRQNLPLPKRRSKSCERLQCLSKLKRRSRSALAALQTATETKEEHIKDLQDELNALEEANKAIEEAVVALQAQLKAKDAKLGQMKKSLATAEASAEDQANQVQKHQGNLAAMELSKDALAMLEGSLGTKEKAALAQQHIQAATQLVSKAKCGDIEERKDARAVLRKTIHSKEAAIKEQPGTLAGLETSLQLKEDQLEQQQVLFPRRRCIALQSSIKAQDVRIDPQKKSLATAEASAKSKKQELEAPGWTWLHFSGVTQQDDISQARLGDSKPRTATAISLSFHNIADCRSNRPSISYRHTETIELPSPC